MLENIDALFDLCKKQPFDETEIKEFIKNKAMDSGEITAVAIKLCDYGMFSYSDFLFEHNREPEEKELRTYNWERLFDILIENGINPDIVISDCIGDSGNFMEMLEYIDDKDLNARILRNLLLTGRGNVNIEIGGTPLFEEIDINFIMDVKMGLYPYKWQVDNVFRFWLVMIGFGGVIKGGKLPVNMLDNNSPEIFRQFENFDYEIVRADNDFELRIIDRFSETVVATV